MNLKKIILYKKDKNKKKSTPKPFHDKGTTFIESAKSFYNIFQQTNKPEDKDAGAFIIET